jgi:hypothetical protein
MKTVLMFVMVMAGCHKSTHPIAEKEPTDQALPMVKTSDVVVNSSGELAIHEKTSPTKKTEEGCYGSGNGMQCLDKEKAEQYREMMKMATSAEEGRKKLAFALISRVLKEEEMKQVEQEGYMLMVQWGRFCPDMCSVPSSAKDDYNAALLQQFKLRTAAAEK